MTLSNAIFGCASAKQRHWGLNVLVGMLLAACIVVHAGPLRADKLSIAHKLAIVDAGRIVPKDDTTVARFRSLLRQLSNKYT